MTPDFAIFAARVRDHIAICAGEFSSDHRDHPDFRAHADIEFNGMALMLFTLQFQNNAAYRKICQARNIAPQSVSHWTQIPAVPTSAFKELELSSLAPNERTTVFYSSGTTEHRPSRHFLSSDSLAIYEASLWPWFEHNVLTPGTSHPAPATSHLTLLALTPPPSLAPNSSLVHMFEVVRRKLGAPESAFLGNIGADSAWSLDFDATLAALNASLATRHPSLLLGTAFSFVHLLDFLAEKNLRLKLPADSRVMETGGYKGRSREMPKAELHALITERLGVAPKNILCEYGMSELSSQAYAVTSDERRVTPEPPASRHTPHVTRHFCFPPWARVQVVSPETGREVAEGETGLLRIFDLANTLSVMAIQTEDLAVRCGDGFDLVGRATQAEARGCSLMSSEFRVSSSEFK